MSLVRPVVRPRKNGSSLRRDRSDRKSLAAVIGTSLRWSPKTALVYRNALDRFLAFARGDLTGASVEHWRDHLIVTERLKPVTVHKLIAAIRAVSKRYAALTGELDFARAAEPPKLDPWTPPSPPAVVDVRAVLDHAERDPTPLGLRDRPMIRLMAVEAGERLGEITAQRTQDLRGDVLSIRRKGGWTQQVQLSDETLRVLRAWLEWSGGKPGRAMFIGMRRTIADEWAPAAALTGAAVAGMLRRRCAAAGIRRVIRPHDLRRFFISALLDAGARPHEVMLAAGHKSLTTTSRYIGRVTDMQQPAGARIASMMAASTKRTNT